ncbi:hypothetical protein HY383_02485 [Candidatus Daviesbacteria bacterium]|nr:hypothetical protein [Candidatus Daviesbacteria bacterium]
MAEAPKFLRGLFAGRDVSGHSGTISAQIQGDAFIEQYTEREIYDSRGIDREYGQIVKEMQRAQGGINNGIPLKGHSSKDVREHQLWLQAHKRGWDIFNYLTSLDEPYQAKVMGARAGGEPLTINDFCRYQITHAGGQLLLADTIHQQTSYAIRHGFADSFRPYADLLSFAFATSRLNIEIERVSLADVLEVDPQKDGVVSQYRFFMDSILVSYRKTHGSVFKTNRRGLFGQYPNLTKYMIESLTAEVRAGILSSPDVVDSDIRSQAGIPREAAQRGQQFVRRVGNIREGIFRHVLNPDAPEFNDLQEAVTFYLRQGKFERLNALYILGLDRFNHIYQMYRVARAFQERCIQPSFYKQIEEAVLEYTHSGMTDGVILNEEDAYEVLDPEQVVDQTAIKVQSFGAIISSIFSKGSQRIFDNIDPVVVDSTGFSRPQVVAVAFDQNRPQRFAVHLRWENQFGESTDLNLYFDTKQAALRDAFDWNFLKLPADPDMRVINVASLSVTQAILLSINTEVSKAYQEKQQKRGMPANQQARPKQKREHITDVVYEMRKQTRQEARIQPTAERVDLSEAIEGIAIPKRILTPEPAEFDEMLQNIHSGERGDVLKSIARFNEERVGEFTRKKSKGPNGETLYTLRVGHTRVLVYEVESSNGVRQFKIMDIDDRSRIYRKSKI